MSSTPAIKPRPVRLVGTVITFCAALFGGLTLVAGFGDNPTIAIISGVGMLVTGAANQALAYWTEGQVVPLTDVGTYLDEDRKAVNGPAAPAIKRREQWPGPAPDSLF